MVGDEFPDKDRRTRINLPQHADEMLGKSGEGGMEGSLMEEVVFEQDC